jgi:hypothetical protein
MPSESSSLQHTPFQLWEAFVRVLMRDPSFMMCILYPLGIVFLDRAAKTVCSCRLKPHATFALAPRIRA